jgi:hypothetical protein
MEANKAVNAGKRWRLGGLLAAMCAAAALTMTGCGTGTTGGEPGGGGGANDGGGDGGGNTASQTDDQTAFRDTTYKLLVKYCVGCHAGQLAGAPAFSHSDVAVAYEAITKAQKVDLIDPAKSRIVLKLTQEKHNCWSNCDADAAEIKASIDAWVKLVGNSPAANTLDQQTLRSAPTTFAASQGESALKKRVNTNLVALYTFKEGTGTVANDISGTQPALNLDLTNVEWVSGQGIKFATATSKAQGTAAASKKLFDAIAVGATASKQYTFEAWITAANLTQTGPARIATYAIDNANNNFGVNQEAAAYSFRNRSLAAGSTVNGDPRLTVANAVKTEVTHLVATFDQTSGRKLYINGTDSGVTDATGPGLLDNWASTYMLTLGNTPANTRAWNGSMFLVAIYNKALSSTEVTQNFNAGFEDRSVLTFDISALSGVAGATIVMQAGEVDKSSYLFASPTYVGPDPNGLVIKGIQIAINDKLPGVGQAFRNVDAIVDAAEVELSGIGTVMAKDAGDASDSFMLVFTQIGSRSNVVPEPAPGPLGMTLDARSVVPVSGVRTYDQINTTMSALTGVPVSNAAVTTVFNQVKTGLPNNANVMSFLSAQQTSIAKLAVEYCDVMVNDTTLRSAFFNGTPAFEFGSAVNVAFNSQAKKDNIINTLINKMIGTNLASQPTLTEAQAALGSLLNDLIAASPNGDAVRTRSNVKGVCGAVLASAALTIN